MAAFGEAGRHGNFLGAAGDISGNAAAHRAAQFAIPELLAGRGVNRIEIAPGFPDASDGWRHAALSDKMGIPFHQWFRSDAACRDYVRRLRWPNGFVCAECGAVGEPWTMSRDRF